MSSKRENFQIGQGSINLKSESVFFSKPNGEIRLIKTPELPKLQQGYILEYFYEFVKKCALGVISYIA